VGSTIRIDVLEVSNSKGDPSQYPNQMEIAKTIAVARVIEGEFKISLVAGF